MDEKEQSLFEQFPSAFPEKMEKKESIDHISQALGHADVKTTKVYLASFSTEDMAKYTEIDLG